MVNALFDTNILIDFLRGIPEARSELRLYSRRAVSVITWIEVLVGTTSETEARVRHFLTGFDLVGLDGEVAERAAQLRRARRMRLPDAVIWASAQANAMLLVTRNTKDFPPDDPGVRVPYQIQ
jgi:predicted nucleic acid-binding protein